jgi:hypothetical protein
MIKADRTIKKWRLSIFRGHHGSCIERQVFSQEYVLSKKDFEMFKEHVQIGLPEDHYIETREIRS